MKIDEWNKIKQALKEEEDNALHINDAPLELTLPPLEKKATSIVDVRKWDDPDLAMLKELGALYVCECPFLRKALFCNSEMIGLETALVVRLVEVDHSIRYLNKKCFLEPSDNWDFDSYTFKLSKGGQYFLDLDKKDERKPRLMIQQFRCIEEIFTEKDNNGHLFGSKNYSYNIIEVKGLELEPF